MMRFDIIYSLSVLLLGASSFDSVLARKLSKSHKHKWGKGGCMSGDLLIQRPSSEDPIALKELQVNDKVFGLDADLMEATCTIITVGEWGLGLTFGQYTSDHYILEPMVGETIIQHGEDGEEALENMYLPISTCPFILDHAGTAFTSMDGITVGNALGPFAVTDYLGMYMIQMRLAIAIPDIMDISAYDLDKLTLQPVSSFDLYGSYQKIQDCLNTLTACSLVQEEWRRTFDLYNPDTKEKIIASDLGPLSGETTLTNQQIHDLLNAGN